MAIRWTLAIVACLALSAAAIWFALWGTPSDVRQENVARLLYLHVPVAVNTLLVFTVSAAAAVVYLRRKSDAADRWSRAAVGVGLLLGTVMLASGMIWARLAWGHWWDFKSHKLMLSLFLWILFIVYFVLRGSLPAGAHRRKVAAAYCIIAYLDVPLVYLSTRFIRTGGEMHGTLGELIHKPPGLAVALPLAMVAATAVAALLLAANLRRLRRADQRADQPPREA